MQVGSIVEPIIDISQLPIIGILASIGIHIKTPVKGKTYTVREISTIKGEVGILLEEVVNISFNGKETLFLIDFFKELMPPTSINIEELIAIEA